MKSKICLTCHGSFPIEEFLSASGITKYAHCRQCRNQRHRRWMRKRLVYNYAPLRAMIVMHMGGECVRCGYKEFGEALQFHSVGSLKERVTVLINRFCYSGTPAAWSALVAAMRQCVLLCSNCQHVDRLGIIKVKGHADCGDMPFPALDE